MTRDDILKSISEIVRNNKRLHPTPWYGTFPAAYAHSLWETRNYNEIARDHQYKISLHDYVQVIEDAMQSEDVE